MSLKAKLKYFFQLTGTLSLLDTLNFQIAKRKNRKSNILFKKTNGDFVLPPDYYLYETFKLDYQQYKDDGIFSAKEIIEWTTQYTPETKKILEWGCGVARIARHLPAFINTDSQVFACDINKGMIDWNKSHVHKVIFDLISYLPPTPYNDNSFDLIYALSVFTHIESQHQPAWIQELARITKRNGIFLFTTHGAMYFNKLNNVQLHELKTNGSYTIPYNKKGHRMMTTYNVYESFRKEIEKSFAVLEYYDGSNNIHKVGGQDLWIVRKK